MEDADVTVVLSLRQWRAVAAHVEGGIYRDVQPILAALYAQVNAQIIAANERAAGEAREAQIAAAQTELAAGRADPDDSAEPHIGAAQPVAVH
jgi:hypothetical protein